jgi:hypothetical protein
MIQFLLEWSNKEMLYHHYSSICFRICQQQTPRNKDVPKLNGTNEIPVYADDVKLLGGNIYVK